MAVRMAKSGKQVSVLLALELGNHSVLGNELDNLSLMPRALQAPSALRSGIPPPSARQTPGALRSINPAQSARQAPGALRSISPAQSNRQAPGALRSKKPARPASKAPGALRSINPAQPASRAPGALRFINPAQPASRAPGALRFINPAQPASRAPGALRSINPAQPASKAPGALRSINPAQPASRAPGALRFINPAQPASRAPGALRFINPAQPASRAPGALRSINPAQPASKAPGALRSKNPAQPASKSPGALRSKNPAQPASKAPGALRSKNPAQPASKSPGALRSKNPAQPASKAPGALRSKNPAQPANKAPGALKAPNNERGGKQPGAARALKPPGALGGTRTSPKGGPQPNPVVGPRVNSNGSGNLGGPNNSKPGNQNLNKNKPCRPVRRREIRDLSTDELNRYINAIKQLHNKTEGAGTKFDKYAEIHVHSNNKIHGGPTFLPWHRHFIRQYELDLQDIDSSIVLPYWDWTIDSQHPEKSVVLSEKMFGGNGDKTKDNCVFSGPFANWQVVNPKPHCLRRDYAGGDTIPALTSIDVMQGILQDTATYSEFRKKIEVHHGPIHLDIGGSKGDLNPMQSPNDPIFFAHHVFIDMLWYNWQQMHPKANQYEGTFKNVPVSPNDPLIYYENVKQKDLLSTRDPSLCYYYDPYHPEVSSLKTRTGFDFKTLASRLLSNDTKKPDNSNNKDKPKETIRSVNPLPDSWIKMNGLDLNDVREIENERNVVTENLNSLGVDSNKGT